MTPTLSIIILNYNSLKLTRRCVEVLGAEGRKDMELIVVDNASAGHEAGQLRALLPWARVVANARNLGYGAGNNVGIRAARGEYVLILNPDVEIRWAEVEKMLAYAKAHCDVGAMGPQLKYPNSTIQDSYRRFPRLLDLLIKRTHLHRVSFLRRRMDHYLMYHVDPHTVQPVDWLVGACLLLPRAALEKAGLFDERFFLFMEDTDLCRRLWEAGYNVVYFPQAQAMHHHKRLSQSRSWRIVFNRNAWHHLASAVKYFWKWHF